MEIDVGPPNADSAHEAIHAIRGYEYQSLAAALAWADLDENGLIYLEVAEDYASVVGSAIKAVQVKATRGSGPVTLNTLAVRAAMESFVNLTDRNFPREVELRFLTTAPIGPEKSPDDRPGGLPGLEYWRRVRAGREDVGPLRTILERSSSPEAVRTFCTSRTDEELLAEFIRRITWDCDRPETSTLRRELEERLSLFLRKEFEFPANRATPFADMLAFRVLQRSALPHAEDRFLSHAELHQLAESFTSVSLPYADHKRLVRRALASPGTSTFGDPMVSTRGVSNLPWVVDAATLPTPSVLIRRQSLETLVHSALRATGVCFVFGASGTGKSILARCIAATFPGPRYWVDLRDTEPSEARFRLKQVFVHLAEMGSATLMLEDLNCLTASSVQTSLAEVVGAARRRDMRVVVTSYGRPTATLLNALSADSENVVSSRHFDLNETSQLISVLGGDPEYWGRVTYLAAGAGHPQLTYAFVAGLASRGWPKHEIAEITARGLTNADLEDEHSAARANLFESQPWPVRELLYRLSFLAAPFERSLAIAIGTLQPPIERAGECFDELVDRWLEPTMADRYRPSPLVRGIGRKMLSADQQRQVDDKIATEMTNRNPIDAGDIDAILVHGLAGASQASLVKLTAAINSVDGETRQAIARHLAVFPFLDTSKPIYPNDLRTSVMLRLTQLRVVLAREERRGVDDIVAALISEIDAAPGGPMRSQIEGAAIGAVLNNLGIARYLSNWVGLLSRFRRVARTDHDDNVTLVPPIPLAAALFSIGVAGLDSVKKLEAVFDALSCLDDDERLEFLTPIDPSVQDYSVLIQHPWTARAKQRDFDAAEAVDSYRKMGTQADTWGLRALSVQCRIAVAMILDERLGDTAGALHALNDTATKFGDEPILAFTSARLHRRIGHATEALAYFRNAISQMSLLGQVEAVHTAREGAICAAECGEWDTARTWFLRAQTVSGPLEAIGLSAIGVGLRADAAVASFQAGDLGDALSLMKDALLSLAEIEPESNLQSAHCHRLIRHAILWLQARVESRDIKIAGKPIEMLPGACSNPEPVPEIEQRPLGHIDFAWYMLGEIESSGSLNVGIRDIVKQFGTQGHIPLPEHALRTQILGAAISAQNPREFSSHFLNYLASATYCATNRDAARRSSNVLNPVRVVIPDLPNNGPYDLVTERLAQHAILAYGVRSLLVGEGDAFDQLHDVLRQKFGDSYFGSSLFGSAHAASSGDSDLDSEVTSILRRSLTANRPPPVLIFRASLRLVKWIEESPFNPVLTVHLKPWLIAHWGRILQSQRFLLYSPATTAPPIEEVLRGELDGVPFAARLALVAEVAVGLRLSPALRQDLERLTRGA